MSRIPDNGRIGNLIALALTDAKPGESVWVDSEGCEYVAVPSGNAATNAISGPNDPEPISWQPKGPIVLLPDGSTAAASRIASHDAEVVDGTLQLSPLLTTRPGAVTLLSEATCALYASDLKPTGASDNLLTTAMNPANWSMSETTYTAAGVPDHQGGRNGVAIRETVINTAHLIAIDLGSGNVVPGSGALCLELFVRPVNRTEFSLYGYYAGATYSYTDALNLTTEPGDIGNSNSNTKNSVYSATKVAYAGNGWFKISPNITPEAGSNSLFYFKIYGGAWNYAGNTANGFDISGLRLYRPRQEAPIASIWTQATTAKKPTVYPFLAPTGGNALSFEHCSAGNYVTTTTAGMISWAAGGAVTLFRLGRLSSAKAFTTGDSPNVRAENTAATSYFEFGLRESSGTKYYVRQNISGGNDISALSSGNASHLPEVEAVVLNGTTAQFYRDGVADGTTQAFALQALTVARVHKGTYGGYHYHQIGDLIEVPRALSAVEVAAFSAELLARHGLAIEPWKLVVVFGQSNAILRSNSDDIPQLWGPKPRTNVPIDWGYEGALPPGTAVVQSDGFVAAAPDPDLTVNYPYRYTMSLFSIAHTIARQLQGKKVAIINHGLGGSGWDVWADGSALMTATLARIATARARIVGPSSVVALVSSLGEGNCGPGVTDTAVLGQVASAIGAFRTGLSSAALPHILLQLSNRQTALDPYRSIVNAGFTLRAAADPYTALVSQDGLATAGDGTHFTAAAMCETGYRVGRALEPYL